METIIARLGTLSRSRMPGSTSVTSATACSWRRAIRNVGELSYIAKEFGGAFPVNDESASVVVADMSSPVADRGEDEAPGGRFRDRRGVPTVIVRAPSASGAA